MNTKQWSWLYGQIKSFIRTYQGKIPDAETATNVMDLYSKIMKVSEKERQNNEDMDDQMRNIFHYLFNIIHALEKEGREL